MRPLLLISLVVVLAACGEKTDTTVASSTQAGTPSATPAQVTPATPAPTVAQDKAALVEEARAAVQALGGTLKKELETAMQSSGPVAAVETCNLKAPEISKTVSGDKGANVSRVSLKPRNPDMGVPNDWQTSVLNDFEARKTAGEVADTLAYAEVVGNEFRFMKAIPTGGVCLACHGEVIAPDISAKIQQLYPNDKAIGFKEGDLRGAFVVVKQLNP